MISEPIPKGHEGHGTACKHCVAIWIGEVVPSCLGCYQFLDPGRLYEVLVVCCVVEMGDEVARLDKFGWKGGPYQV